jgi:hypothetical protein
MKQKKKAKIRARRAYEAKKKGKNLLRHLHRRIFFKFFLL